LPAAFGALSPRRRLSEFRRFRWCVRRLTPLTPIPDGAGALHPARGLPMYLIALAVFAAAGLAFSGLGRTRAAQLTPTGIPHAASAWRGLPARRGR
jgi:hypothetical protein